MKKNKSFAFSSDFALHQTKMSNISDRHDHNEGEERGAVTHVSTFAKVS